MRAYYFLNDQYGLENLRHRRLKLARINELNDPYEMITATTDANVRRALNVTKDHLHEKYGIVCFTRSWRSLLMWSHYADGHRGMCLGFDISADLREVTYVKRPVALDREFFDLDAPEKELFMQNLISTKSNHWKYERESRIFANLEHAKDGYYFIDFSGEIKLKEVIIGERCSVSRETLREALGDLTPSVTTMKARLAFRSFPVVRQRRESLWK